MFNFAGNSPSNKNRAILFSIVQYTLINKTLS